MKLSRRSIDFPLAYAVRLLCGGPSSTSPPPKSRTWVHDQHNPGSTSAANTLRTASSKFSAVIFHKLLHCFFLLGGLLKRFHIGLLKVTSVQVALSDETESIGENDMLLPVL